MKYFRFQILAALFWLATTAVAQVNVLRVASASYPAGKTLPLAIEMDNQNDITGVQFDISVPYELAVDSMGQPIVELSPTRAASHRVAARKRTTEWRSPGDHGGVSTYHVYRVIVYSDENALVLDNSGTLLTLQLPLAGDAANGAVFPVYLLPNSVTLSDRQKQNVLSAQQDGTVTIEVIPRPDLQPADVTFTPSTVDPEGELTVTWSVANIGQVATEAGWNEQVELVAMSGGTTRLLATTYYEGTLAAGASVSRQTTVQLPALLGIDGLARVRVSVVPDEQAGEHPSLRDNNIAETTQNLTVGKRLSLELSRQRVSEGYPQTVSCKLSRSGRWNNIRNFTIATTADSRIDVPRSVTIPAHQSGVVFYLTVNNNDQLDADSIVDVTVSGDGYEPVTARLVIVDDELPALSVKASQSDVSEGDVFQLTVSAARPSAQPIVVTLTSEDARRFSLPAQVTIPAGQTEATVSVTVVDNDVPNLEQSYRFTASAQQYDTGEALVMVHDDDMPVLSLTLTPNKVSEAAGPTSVAAVLTRTGRTDNKITIRLSDDAEGALYYANRSIEMPRGVETVYFNLGPVDNTLKDGDRTYTLTAGVWVSACNCASAGEQAGNVSAQLTVLDNDGASLSLTTAASTVKEGGTTTLTVSRNTTDNSQPLTVRLTSDYDAELTYEHAATIPAGQQSVDIAVASAKNDVAGDSHTVVFTVEADGYGSGTCYLLVTDQTLPDARISSITASPDQAVVGSAVTLTVTVANEGAAPLAAGTAVTIYRRGSSETLGSLRTEADIAVGDSAVLVRRVPLPDEVGEHAFFAVVNEQKTITELVYSNNTSADVRVKARSPFTASVATDKKVYTQGELVVVSGQLTGERSVNAQAEVYFINDGIRQTQTVTTDADGRFRLEWMPYALQSGHFIAGACYPGDKTIEEQAAFDIYGLRRSSNGYITEDVIVGDTRQGQVRLLNPGKLRLTEVRAEKVGGPETVSVVLDVPSTIDGGAEATLTYQLTGSAPTAGNNWEEIIVRVTSAEGISLDISILYYGRAATGNLVVESQQLTTTMLKDRGRDLSFTLTNNGRGHTGRISLALPDWMSALTGATMAGLAQNDTATVVLRLMPTADMQLNVPVTGRIGINCENGNGTYVNFTVTPVSDARGVLVVDVADEYTYYTQEAPHVAGAEVVLRNPVTEAVVEQGITDADGLFRVELPEGYYQLCVTADNHDSYRNNVVVDPGTTTRKVVNLSYQSISVSWDVVETEVEDEYNIVTTLQYETNVPMPVVETIVPDRIEATSLGVGESLVFNAVLTNKGLITAQQTSFTMDEFFGGYRWQPLVENTGLTLAPQQAVVIPVKVTRLADADSVVTAPRRAGGNPNCTQAPWTVYSWECGDDHKWHRYPRQIQFDICPSSGGGGGGYYGGGGGPGSPNGGGGSGYSSWSGGGHVTIDDDCDPCTNDYLKKWGECGVSFIPKLGCMYGSAACVRDRDVVNGNGWRYYTTCTLTGIGCLTEFCAEGAVVALPFTFGSSIVPAVACSTIGAGINVINCLIALTEPCGNRPWWNSFVPWVGSKRSPRRADAAEPSWLTDYRLAAEIPTQEHWAHNAIQLEIFGDTAWVANTTLEELQAVLTAALKQEGTVDIELLRAVKPQGISEQQLAAFVERLNNTTDFEATGTAHDNMIHVVRIDEYVEMVEAAEAASREMGYANTDEMWLEESKKFKEHAEGHDQSVCSTITLQISQTMTMTRQAFRGTLTVYNGNKTQAMENVRLALNVTNRQTLQQATAREMEMHTESLRGFTGELPMDAGWHLGADSTGTATILFIPSKYAAPEQPVEYSFGGTLSYVDPYTGLEVTRELYPVTLTVKPSPELDLTYFMQRDIFGDDPLTEAVEPMAPAEFALVINNKGYGDATNVRMLTNQPEIIDNKKGLLIDFEFIASQLNGADKALALGQSIPTDFGTIPAHSQTYAQWWLQSSLLGHFVKYDIEATHVSSYGNENLSLLDQVTIHELIHGFTPTSPAAAPITPAAAAPITPAAAGLRVPDGSPVGRAAGRAFLVNDVADADDQPDRVYFTDGTHAEASTALSVTIAKQSDTQYLLSVVPQQAGWTYASLLDPTVGRQQLVGITRQSDQAAIALDNLWQTDRTLFDGKEWRYENRLHIVADLPLEGESFVLTFNARPAQELVVSEFVGVPSVDSVASVQVKQVTVRFNKAIDPATFTTADLSLSCQGRKLDASLISIASLSQTDYVLDLSAITAADGYYVLTVQTAGITDSEGFQGSVGRQATWVQFAGGKLALAIVAQPAEGGNVSPASGTYNYGEALTLTATAAEGYDFARWMQGDQLLSDSVSCSYIPQGSATLTAVFAPKSYAVTISYDARGGTVTGGGTGIYTHGQQFSLSATAAQGWQFGGWVVDGELFSAEAAIVYVVGHAATIEAVFVELPSGILSGRVVREGDGIPVGGATVTLQRDTIRYAATTDSYGYYQLRVADKSLTYDITCRADGYIWSPTEQIWFDEGQQTKNFALLRGATVVLPAEGACTFSAPISLTLPTTGVQAWLLTRYDRQNFVVEQVTAASITAGEGIVLSGTPGQRIDMTEAAEATPLPGNLLVGTPLSPYVVSTGDVYLMREGTADEAAFYLAAQGELIGKGKAYCQFILADQPSRVSILWDEASLVKAVLAGAAADAPHYDLQGRRIRPADADTRHKQVHIVKGRKVVVK